MHDNRHPKSLDMRRRSIYLLPNLFTTGALFAGFFAIVQSMNGRYETAAVAVFVAMVLDGLDGRIARLTRTQSEFGAQYDSLSDMVSFGVAPALIMYEWAFRSLGKWGWFAAFIYCCSAALRLARFNTNHDILDKRFFQGLPSPAAAALTAGFVWVIHDYGLSGEDVKWVASALTVFAGLSMISNLKYYSFKTFDLRKSVPFIAIFLLAMILVVISSYPPGTLFLVFLGYGLSAYVAWGVELWHKRTAPPNA